MGLAVSYVQFCYIAEQLHIREDSQDHDHEDVMSSYTALDAAADLDLDDANDILEDFEEMDGSPG